MKGLQLVSYNPALVQRFAVDSSNATAIYKGGGVIAVLDGNVDGWDGSANAAYIGVVMGVFDSDGLETTYLAATTAGYVDVCIDPFAIMSIQADASLTSVASNFGSADLSSNAGSTSTGESTAELDTTIAADDQFKILGLDGSIGNDWDDDNPQVLITPNIHFLKGTTALTS